jgi:hypothetical protein
MGDTQEPQIWLHAKELENITSEYVAYWNEKSEEVSALQREIYTALPLSARRPYGMPMFLRSSVSKNADAAVRIQKLLSAAELADDKRVLIGVSDLSFIQSRKPYLIDSEISRLKTSLAEIAELLAQVKEKPPKPQYEPLVPYRADIAIETSDEPMHPFAAFLIVVVLAAVVCGLVWLAGGK